MVEEKHRVVVRNERQDRMLPPQLYPSSSIRPPPSGRAGGNTEQQVLFKNLVEMVPLVESLMDRRANPSFKRRASMVYTAAPSNSTTVSDPNGKKSFQTVSTRKQKDHRDNASNNITDKKDSGFDNLSISLSKSLLEEDVQQETEELILLREQLDNLQKDLVEKDEALKSAEESISQTNVIHETVSELKRQVVEKDLLLRSANSQLSNAEIKLAERHAIVEKLDTEARTSNSKVEELQGDLDSMDFEISAFMQLFQELSRDSSEYSEENITSFHRFDHLPYLDNIDETKMEAARIDYIAAVAAAKETPSDESIAAAAEARLKLEAFVL